MSPQSLSVLSSSPRITRFSNEERPISTQGWDPILGLPDELSVKILSYLPINTLVECSLASKAWYRVSRDDLLVWKQIVERTFPHWKDLAAPAGFRDTYILNHVFHYNLKKGIYATSVFQEEHRGDIFGLTIAEGVLYLSFADCTIQAWDLATRTRVASFSGYTEVARNLAVAGGILYSISYHGNFKAWNLSTKQCVSFSEPEFQQVRALTGDGDLLYASDNEGVIKIWDTATGQWMSEISAHQVGTAHRLAALRNHFFYAGGFPNCKVRAYNCATQKTRDAFLNLQKNVSSLAAASGVLCIGFSDGTIQVQDAEKDHPIAAFKEMTRQVRYLGMHAGSLYSTSSERAILGRYFTASNEVVFRELAGLMASRNPQSIEEAFDRFNRMPESAREKIYLELYYILVFDEMSDGDSEWSEEIEDLDGIREWISERTEVLDDEVKKAFFMRIISEGREAFYNLEERDPELNAVAIENYLSL